MCYVFSRSFTFALIMRARHSLRPRIESSHNRGTSQNHSSVFFSWKDLRLYPTNDFISNDIYLIVTEAVYFSSIPRNELNYIESRYWTLLAIDSFKASAIP